MYVVKVHTGYVIRDHWSAGGYAITLYKSPKGFSLRGWVEEQKRRASTRVAAEIKAINAEGGMA